MHFNIFPGQHNRQTYILEPLWLVSESAVESRFPLPRFLQQQDVLLEEWYNIPLETIRNFYIYESIPRRILTVLHANGGPTPY